MADNDNNQDEQYVQSVTSGGESVTLDTEARKASQRAANNDDRTNIANRRVRPYFQGCQTGRLPGW